MLTKYHRSEIVLVAVMVFIFLASVATAAKSGAVAKGTTADFTRAYPWVMIAITGGLLSLIVILLGVIGYFLNEKEKREKEDARKMVAEIKATGDTFNRTASELYNLHRALTKTIDGVESRLSTVESRCGDRTLLCPAYNPSLRQRIMALVDSEYGEER